jgi:hypothetical protein
MTNEELKACEEVIANPGMGVAPEIAHRLVTEVRQLQIENRRLVLAAREALRTLNGEGGLPGRAKAMLSRAIGAVDPKEVG